MNENCGPILLVEDNENDVYFMQRAAKSAGIANQLQVVKDGQGAIDYLAGTGPFQNREHFPFPCMVLLDLKLPVKDGLEVLSWIRQQPKFRRLVVIILTTSRELTDIAAAYDIGVNSYLVKPSDVSVLVEMIAALKQFWIGFNQFPILEPPETA
jgi:CheY-like chemotaxis protein